MPKKKIIRNKTSEEVVNEPITEYLVRSTTDKRDKVITLSSLEDQEEENYHYWRTLTPENRLRLHLRLIQQFYNLDTEPAKPPFEKEIIID